MRKCKRGHERIPENLYSSGNCKLCEKGRDRRQYYLDNKEHIDTYNKEYYQQNREVHLNRGRAWYRANRERRVMQTIEYASHRRDTDLNFRLACNLRSRLSIAVRHCQKAGSAVADLGITIPEFKLWIYSQFEGGMGWDNYGEWHLDHVKPLASFDLTDREQFLEACNWLNYQPLWAEDNLRKGAR